MWDLPRPGIKPVSLVSQGRFLTTGPPGKPQDTILKDFFLPLLAAPWIPFASSSSSIRPPKRVFQGLVLSPFPFLTFLIPVELFQILKDDAVKVLHSICQQIWNTQQWPQDWKRSFTGHGKVFIPIPKKGNAKECSNYRTVALISHTSKVVLKILQARLQQYMNREFPDVQAGI